MTNLKFKKLHPDAVKPARAHSDDCGLDLVAVGIRWDNELQFYEYDTGLAFELPPGYLGLLSPRSSVSKTGLHLCNGSGVLDPAYRGSVKARFYKKTLPGIRSIPYAVGDKILQLILVPIWLASVEEVEELGDSERGIGSFGSTGK